jgi:hypothetical protein
LELDIEPPARTVYVDESPPTRPDGFVYGKDLDLAVDKRPEESPPQAETPKPAPPFGPVEAGIDDKKKTRQFNYIILFVVLILIIGGVIFLLLLPDNGETPAGQPGESARTVKQEEQVTEKEPVAQKEGAGQEKAKEPIEVDMEKTAAAAAETPPRGKSGEKSAPPPVEKETPPAASEKPPDGATGSALEHFKKGDFVGASEIWRLKVKSQAATHTILLELDCQKESVFNAYNRIDRKEDFFILTRSREGRTCYLVCWGKFLSREEAVDSLREVPNYFLQQPNPPQVVPLSRYLR